MAGMITRRYVNTFIYVSLLLIVLIPVSIQAIKFHDDPYWQERAEIARNATHDNYNPNPEEVTEHLNRKVTQSLVEYTNDTRRILRNKKYNGGCLATNPIDRCWRCNPNWMANRQQLAKCPLGFGHNTRGGYGGRIYVVRDSSDNDVQNPKPGTLRHAVIQEVPLWIIFSTSMTIKLSQELIMTSRKTIDGRGVMVHIASGAGITIQYVSNIIIHNIRVHDTVSRNGGMIRDSVNHMGIRTRSDGDGISLFGATNVWIDHVSMSNCADGLIDAIMGSTAVTISNCHFTKHNDVMLLGASGSTGSIDRKMQVTVAFNHFGHDLIQRMPRARWGFVHVVNNDYTHWLMYAIGGSNSPTIISQGNRFIAPPDIKAKEVTKRDYAMPSEWSKWQWRSQGDQFLNGAFFVQSGSPNTRGRFGRYDVINAKPGSTVTRLTRFAGPLSCRPHQPC
ncbi:pectate lyase-like [Impatiens glandulifera]|uniref:pectate lyase-like n=1 Tax=Impatiens glandulifera TaxID=253017 RepID=UPI001FB129AA|nr:pectate lyase-like [Impatiens glandulifera]